MILTFRYNSMLTFIQVSFCFLLFLRLGLGLGLRSAIAKGRHRKGPPSQTLTLTLILTRTLTLWRWRPFAMADLCDGGPPPGFFTYGSVIGLGFKVRVRFRDR